MFYDVVNFRLDLDFSVRVPELPGRLPFQMIRSGGADMEPTREPGAFAIQRYGSEFSRFRFPSQRHFPPGYVLWLSPGT